MQLSVMTKLYSLAINNQTILEIETEAPAWLPVKPRINRRWLRSALKTALIGYFDRQMRFGAHVYLN